MEFSRGPSEPFIFTTLLTHRPNRLKLVVAPLMKTNRPSSTLFLPPPCNARTKRDTRVFSGRHTGTTHTPGSSRCLVAVFSRSLRGYTSSKTIRGSRAGATRPVKGVRCTLNEGRGYLLSASSLHAFHRIRVCKRVVIFGGSNTLK